MGIKIPKGAYFLGVPLITVRNVLKAWRYGGSTDAAQIASLSHIGLDARTVIVLLDELRDLSSTAKRLCREHRAHLWV